LCGYFGEEIDVLQIFQPIAKSLCWLWCPTWIGRWHEHQY